MPTGPQIAKIGIETGFVALGEFLIQRAKRPLKRVGYDAISFGLSEYVTKDKIKFFLKILEMPEIQSMLADLIGSYGISYLIDMLMSEQEPYQRKAILYIIAIFGENVVAMGIPMVAKS